MYVLPHIPVFWWATSAPLIVQIQVQPNNKYRSGTIEG